MATKKYESDRIYFLDEVRGFVIILMVLYHLFFTAGYVFGFDWGRTFFQFFKPSAPYFAAVFIVLCGISCRLSRSNVKRGIIIGVAAILLSVIMHIAITMGILTGDSMIWFGILHFLAVSILLFALLRPILDKIPPFIGILVCVFFVLLTAWVSPNDGGFFGIKGLFEIKIPDILINKWLYPLGFSHMNSSDYFPLLPWFFVFLGGSFIGVWAKARRFPKWMYRSHVQFLSLAGTHTLIIYLIHQPVIYATLWLVKEYINNR